ncbi:hypothetical protein CRUP_030205 [Coryphaenoides rupestris]|nr:hypothetical protein CRUP_030205 [Coryphaenoides rupestris]
MGRRRKEEEEEEEYRRGSESQMTTGGGAPEEVGGKWEARRDGDRLPHDSRGAQVNFDTEDSRSCGDSLAAVVRSSGWEKEEGEEEEEEYRRGSESQMTREEEHRRRWREVGGASRWGSSATTPGARRLHGTARSNSTSRLRSLAVPPAATAMRRQGWRGRSVSGAKHTGKRSPRGAPLLWMVALVSLWLGAHGQMKIPPETVQQWAESFGKQLVALSNRYSGAKLLQKKYKDIEGMVKMHRVDGEELVKTFAEEMEEMLGRKVESVKFDYYNSLVINTLDEDGNPVELGGEFSLEENEHFNSLPVNTQMSDIQTRVS